MGDKAIKLATVGAAIGFTVGTGGAGGFALAAAGAGAGASLGSSIDARENASKAAKIADRRNKLQTTIRAIENVKQAQKERARIIASGEAQGVGDSSAVIGGAGSTQSTAGSNLSFAQQIFNLQNSQSRLQSSSAGNQGLASAFSQVAVIAGNRI